MPVPPPEPAPVVPQKSTPDRMSWRERVSSTIAAAREHPWHGKVLGAVAFAALVIIAFVIGTLIHGFEPSEVKAAQTKSAPAPAVPVRPSPRSNVTLVPVTGTDAAVAPIEQPITTAPAEAPGQQPNDATALPADQYAAAAARAKAERIAAEKAARTATIDPRTLTGAAYEPAPQSAETTVPRPAVRANQNPPESATAPQPGVESAPTPSRTSAYLEYKPLPHIAVDHDMTARVNLTVNEDGRVTGIDVIEPVPQMLKVISAVQNWRFKAATENGTPVTSHVAIDITFRANE